MKKRFIKLFVPLTVAALALSGCGKTEEAQETVLTPVEVQVMENSSIKKELAYQGQVQPNETVDVTSKLSGLVESVKYDVGDYVNAGDILFTLDKKDIQDQIKNLEASLKVSDASVQSAQTGLNQVTDGGQIQSSRLSLENAVTSAEKGVENAEKTLSNAKIQLDNTRSSLDDVKKKYDDTKTLYDSGVVSRSDFEAVELAYTQAQNSMEQVQISYEQAQIAYDQAVDSLSTAQQSLDIFNSKTTSDNVESAQQGVNTAQASRQAVETQLQIARETLNDTSVKAPISGFISKKNITETNMVSAQSAPYTIVDMSKVTVEVKVSEKVINLINVGDSVDVSIPTIGNDNITGIIKTISPAVDNTNTYPVKIEIENSDASIKSGMFAEIHFIESQAENTIVVPRNTVLESDSESYVFVIDGKNAVKRVVETGIDNGESIQLVSGVNVGDRVIVNGQDYVIDGEEVNIVSDGSGDEGESENDKDTSENEAKEE